MNDTFIAIGQDTVRGLTQRQRNARNGKLTSSRVACLMTGDTVKIHRLWMEMTGQSEEEDLSGVWSVQLGLATERLNLDWAERKLGEQVIDRGVFIQHPMLEWAGATLDGMLRDTQRPIEAKHCGGREPLETIIERYQPQLQWIMECSMWRPRECALSVILGSNEPVIEWVMRDEQYAGEMTHRGAQFMEHVRNRTPPVELPSIPHPVIPTRSYDMTGRNEWAVNAITWNNTWQAARDFRDADRELKSLVPDDAKDCSGYGVIAKRDRAGRIRIFEKC